MAGEIEAGEVVGRDGEAALPAVAGSVGGEGGGEEFQRFAAGAGGDFVFYHINLQNRCVRLRVAGKGQRHGGGMVDDAAAAQGQRQAVGFRAFAAQIGFGRGCGRHGDVVPLAGRGNGGRVGFAQAGGEVLFAREAERGTAGEGVLRGGGLYGAAVRLRQGGQHGFGAAAQLGVGGCRTGIAAAQRGGADGCAAFEAV
jgi:hypothetical protein